MSVPAPPCPPQPRRRRRHELLFQFDARDGSVLALHQVRLEGDDMSAAEQRAREAAEVALSLVGLPQIEDEITDALATHAQSEVRRALEAAALIMCPKCRDEGLSVRRPGEVWIHGVYLCRARKIRDLSPAAPQEETT